VLTLAMAVSSCAYYNTFYLARKYYGRASSGDPYPIDPVGGATMADYGRAIDYSKKVLTN
jgi:hypothetical protein